MKKTRNAATSIHIVSSMTCSTEGPTSCATAAAGVATTNPTTIPPTHTIRRTLRIRTSRVDDSEREDAIGGVFRPGCGRVTVA